MGLRHRQVNLAELRLAWMACLCGLAPFAQSSCGTQVDPSSSLPKLDARLAFQDARLSGSGRIAVIDSLLVIVEPFSPHVHIASVPMKRILRSAIRQGNGPLEARGLLWVQSIVGSGEAWAYDQRRRRILRFRPSEVVSGGDEAVEFIQLSPGPPVPTVPVVLSDRILSMTTPDTIVDRFLWIDFEGNHIGFLPNNEVDSDVASADARDPRVGPSDLRPAQLFPAYDGRGFAQVGFIEERIRFFTTEGRLTHEAVGPSWTEATGPTTLGPTAMTDATRITYTSSSATRHMLALLRSHRAMKDMFPNLQFGAEEIHFYAWDGEFVGAFKLPGEFIDIAFSDDGKEIFLYRVLPEPAIFVAAVPKCVSPI